MKNPILDSLGNNPQNNVFQILDALQSFRNQLSGQNPKTIVDQLRQSGRMTDQQLDSLLQQAQGITSSPQFRRFLKTR